MSWYDTLSHIYDLSLEPAYRVHRQLAVETLDVRPDSVVLDLPCGTGQSLPALLGKLGPEGAVLAVDLSDGMLRQAGRRVSRAGWSNVHTLQGDALTLTHDTISETVGRAVRPDRLHIFLGMTVFPEPEAVFENLWSLLAPGGRCVIADVHSARPSLQGHMVNWMAQADIRRRWWEPLEAVGLDFERSALPYRWDHGGQMFAATATKSGGR